MMRNTQVNWDAFEYKNSGNKREAFENLAYYLFCYEFDQSYGIFRYFNQPHIETQPIKYGEDVVGFQAKYYDEGTSLSSKEAELKDAIVGAKKKYPDITSIIFYINKEFSSSSKPDTDKPKYQENIEQCGEQVGVKIQWRVKSHFEKMLLEDDLVVVRDLYFNAEKGIESFLKNVKAYSDKTRDNIKSNIVYKNQEIKINIGTKMLESENRIAIVYGEAGTGKSGYVKDTVLKIADSAEAEYLFFSASDMDIKEISLFLKSYGEYSLDDLFKTYKNESHKYLVIDSAEKYTTFNHVDTFREIIKQFVENNWNIIVTIRTAYKESFCNNFLENLYYDEYKIDCISNEKLISLGEEYGFLVPTDIKTRDLLCNLFYLKIYLSLNLLREDVPKNTEEFHQYIWTKVVRKERVRRNNLPQKREHFIVKMALEMLKNEDYVYKIDSNDDYETYIELEESGIINPIDNDYNIFKFSHDMYEEITVKHILKQRLEKQENVNDFFDCFGNSLRSRKMFRIWLEALLCEQDEKCSVFLTDILNSDELSQSWKDEALIALIDSEDEVSYLILESMLSKNDYELFTRTIFILNTACRGINLDWIKKFPDKTFNQYRVTKPVGKAWSTLFKYIMNNRTIIPWTGQNITLVLNALKAWVDASKSGETTRLAGNIALFLKSEVFEKERPRYSIEHDETYKLLIEIILKASIELKDELNSIFNAIIENDSLSYRNRDENYIIMKMALSNVLECGEVCTAIPSTIVQLAKSYWLHQKEEDYFSHSMNIDAHFGVNQNLNHDYYPASALQTPTYKLLDTAFVETLEMIIEIINYTTECYKKSHLNTEYKECFEIELFFPDGTTRKQICSTRLWKLYRGTSVGSHLIESILMALEKKLLEIAVALPEKAIQIICMHLLKNSSSAAITAVVLSVVMKQPDKLFDIACILLQCKEIFQLDITRRTSESEANFLKDVFKNNLHNEERIQSNNQEFREITFESVIINYQIKAGELSEDKFNERKRKLYDIIDRTTTDIDKWDVDYRYPYYRMDLRCYVGEKLIENEDGTKYIQLSPDLPKELVNHANKALHKNEKMFKFLALRNWSYDRYNGNFSKCEKYHDYEETPSAVIKEIQEILKLNDNECNFFDKSGAIYSAVVLLRDFKEKLTIEQMEFCKRIVLDKGYNIISEQGYYQVGDGSEAVISELARMVNSDEMSASWENPLFILLACTMKRGEFSEFATRSVSKILWDKKGDVAIKFLNAYIKIRPDVVKKVHKYNGKPLVEFFEDNSNDIEDAFKANLEDIDFDNVDDLDLDSKMHLNLMLNSTLKIVFDLVLSTGNELWKEIFSRQTQREDSTNYDLEYKYRSWLAEYILNIPTDMQRILIERMMPCISYDKEFADWIFYIIAAEDITPKYESFWNIWSFLQNYIFHEYDLIDNKHTDTQVDHLMQYGINSVIISYMFAGEYWNKKAYTWHSLKKENGVFFNAISNRMPDNVFVLYSIVKVLNSIGKNTFFEEGVAWISRMVKDGKDLETATLPTNTLYYLEEYMYDYLTSKHFDFRANLDTKRKVLNVLDFMVKKGSTVGFLLRDAII